VSAHAGSHYKSNELHTSDTAIDVVDVGKVVGIIISCSITKNKLIIHPQNHPLHLPHLPPS
jgi:hypothetical protein